MDFVSKVPEINLIKHENIPNAWQVEHIDADGDGGIAVTVFDGCNPKARAEQYAAWLRSHVRAAA